MGSYTKDIVVSANTTEDTAEFFDMVVNEGLLDWLTMSLQSNDSKVRIKVFHNGVQILPTNSDGAYRANNRDIDTKPRYKILTRPLLRFKVWNSDDVTHEVYARAEVTDGF